jgi:hypothetical protein
MPERPGFTHDTSVANDDVLELSSGELNPLLMRESSEWTGSLKSTVDYLMRGAEDSMTNNIQMSSGR